MNFQPRSVQAKEAGQRAVAFWASPAARHLDGSTRHRAYRDFRHMLGVFFGRPLAAGDYSILKAIARDRPDPPDYFTWQHGPAWDTLSEEGKAGVMQFRAEIQLRFGNPGERYAKWSRGRGIIWSRVKSEMKRQPDLDPEALYQSGLEALAEAMVGAGKPGRQGEPPLIDQSFDAFVRYANTSIGNAIKAEARFQKEAAGLAGLGKPEKGEGLMKQLARLPPIDITPVEPDEDEDEYQARWALISRSAAADDPGLAEAARVLPDVRLDLERLTDAEREALFLRSEGLPYIEIAAETGLPNGKAAERLFKAARDKLGYTAPRKVQRPPRGGEPDRIKAGEAMRAKVEAAEAAIAAEKAKVPEAESKAAVAAMPDRLARIAAARASLPPGERDNPAAILARLTT